MALPNFNGVSGFSPDIRPPTTPLLSDERDINPDIAAGAFVDATPVTQQFHFLNEFDEAWLPYAYPAERFVPNDQQIAWDPTNATADVGGPIKRDSEYSVQSYVMHPTAAQLDALPPPTNVPAKYTATGDSLDTRIQNLALEWTAGDTTNYQKVMSIQDHLTDGTYTYDTKVQARTSADALTDFLLFNKRGFCEQFAAAMAVLLRTLGIPTRLAVGFDSGNRSPEGNTADTTWTVTSRDAHTWPEVLFPTYGWLQFEPTPGVQAPSTEAYLFQSTGPEPCLLPAGAPSLQQPGQPGTGARSQPDGQSPQHQVQQHQRART